jgi:hypothetical protein
MDILKIEKRIYEVFVRKRSPFPVPFLDECCRANQTFMEEGWPPFQYSYLLPPFSSKGGDVGELIGWALDFAGRMGWKISIGIMGRPKKLGLLIGSKGCFLLVVGKEGKMEAKAINFRKRRLLRRLQRIFGKGPLRIFFDDWDHTTSLILQDKIRG